MASRFVAGVLGGIAGIIPLAANAAVDYAATQGLLDATTAHWAQSPLLAGPPALLSGVALGGIVAGWPAGRRGGAAAAAAAGGIAAGLYAVVVTGLVVGGARLGLVPSVAAVHPLRASAAVIFLASVLLAVAWLLGAVVGSGATTGAAARMGDGGRASTGPRTEGGRGQDLRMDAGWQRGRSGYADRNGYNDDDGVNERLERGAYDPYARRAPGGASGLGGGDDRAGRERGRSGPPDRGAMRDGALRDAPRTPAGTRERRPGSRPMPPNRW
jgi:hypothetical protein